MPTTGPIQGHNLRVRFGTTATTSAIYAATECSLSLETDSTEVNHKDNFSAGVKEVIPTATSWTVSTSGLVFFDQTTTIDDVITAQLAKTEIYIDFSTNVTGDVKWSGQAYITSCELSASVGEIATYSVTFSGASVLTQATQA